MAEGPAVRKTIDVHIVTPEQEVWAGDAHYVLARSASGDLGVLPGHEPVLAVLGAGPLRVETPGGDKSWGVEGGFLSVGRAGDVTRVDVLAEFVTDDPESITPRSGITAGPAAEAEPEIPGETAGP